MCYETVVVTNDSLKTQKYHMPTFQKVKQNLHKENERNRQARPISVQQNMRYLAIVKTTFTNTTQSPLVLNTPLT